MAFTKRHYEEVARIIKAIHGTHVSNYGGRSNEYTAGRNDALRMMQEDLRRMFAADNPRFDGTRFDMACEPRSEK